MARRGGLRRLALRDALRDRDARLRAGDGREHRRPPPAPPGARALQHRALGGAPAADGREQAITGANPYAGERKIQVNPRLFPSLWVQYEQLAVEIRQAGGRATVTDLVNAVLHYRGPDNAQDAHALLNRLSRAHVSGAARRALTAA